MARPPRVTSPAPSRRMPWLGLLPVCRPGASAPFFVFQRSPARAVHSFPMEDVIRQACPIGVPRLPMGSPARCYRAPHRSCITPTRFKLDIGSCFEYPTSVSPDGANQIDSDHPADRGEPQDPAAMNASSRPEQPVCDIQPACWVRSRSPWRGTGGQTGQRLSDSETCTSPAARGRIKQRCPHRPISG